MTVEELVDEGRDFLQAFPDATARRVRSHLLQVVGGAAEETEQGYEFGRYMAPGGGRRHVHDWFIGPIAWVVGRVNEWRHAGRIEAAVRELFPEERPKRRKKAK